MVVENMISAFQAEKAPWKSSVLGFIYTTIGIFLAYAVFKSHASITAVFLVTMAALPLVYQLTVMEEQKDLEGYDESWLLKEHAKALSSFIWLFAGITIAYALWYTFLPGEMSSILFETQRTTINTLNGYATGTLSVDFGIFTKVFLNNVRVLIFCILFSFLYGAGAIFILAWNASIIGVAIGNVIRQGLAELANMTGFALVGGYFQVVGYSLLRYAIHGLPEIASYFIAGLAGGIISIAVIKHDMGTRKFEHVLLDSADLLLISLVLVFLAGILEVWVTPLFF